MTPQRSGLQIGGRHRLALPVVLLVLCAALAWLILRPAPAVHGNLSRRDVSAIVRAVRSDVRREAFPDFSWRTLKQAPARLWSMFTARIDEVDATFEGQAKVRGRFGLETIQAVGEENFISRGFDSWTVKKEAGIWTVKVRSARTVKNAMPVSRFDDRRNLSAGLSNNARLSLEVQRREGLFITEPVGGQGSSFLLLTNAPNNPEAVHFR